MRVCLIVFVCLHGCVCEHFLYVGVTMISAREEREWRERERGELVCMYNLFRDSVCVLDGVRYMKQLSVRLCSGFEINLLR